MKYSGSGNFLWSSVVKMELSFSHTIPIWYRGATAPFGKRTCETVRAVAVSRLSHEADRRLDTLSNLLIASIICAETTLDLVYNSSILIILASVKDLQLDQWI